MKTFMTKEDYEYLADIRTYHLIDILKYRLGVSVIPIQNGEHVQTTIIVVDHERLCE
ncbi:MAG: hypothetical protein PHR07_03995 [Acidaminococcaceae bacterium]|nr:hypothetical protein [Acidaminococcaceae bacterium]